MLFVVDISLSPIPTKHFQMHTEYKNGKMLFKTDYLTVDVTTMLSEENEKKVRATTAESYRELGNEYYRKKEYKKAFLAYSDGLELDPIHISLKFNKAMAAVAIEYYGTAMLELVSLCRIDSVRQKALMRRVKLTYFMSNYDECSSYLGDMLDEFGTEMEFKDQHEKFTKMTRKRVFERNYGEFEYKSMFEKAKSNMILDYSPFNFNLKVDMDDVRGLGFFSRHEIPFGKMFLASKAHSIACGDTVNTSEAVLAIEFYKKAQDCYFNQVFKKMYTEWSGRNPTLEMESVCNIVQSNAYQLGDLYPGYCGIFKNASYINHSCMPNSQNFFIGNFMFVLSTRNIRPDRELTLSYIDVGLPPKDRKKILEDRFHFTCDCELCLFDEMCMRKSPHFKYILENYATLCKQAQLELEDWEKLRSFLKFLKDRKSDSAAFRRGVLLYSFCSHFDDLEGTVVEMLECFRPSESRFISGKYYEKSLAILMFNPKYAKMLDSYIRQFYFEGYPLKDLLFQTKNK